MKSLLIIILLFLNFVFTSFSQDKDLPALQSELKDLKGNNDSNKAGKALFLIGAYYHNHQLPDSAIIYYHKALILSKNKNDHLIQGRIYHNLSMLSRANIDSALYYAGLSLEHRTLAKDSLEMGHSYLLLADLYDETGAYSTALKYNLDAVRVYERHNDKRGLINGYNNIAILYGNLGEYRKRIDYYKIAIITLKENPDSMRLAGVYGNLANAYKELNKSDSAFYFYDESLKIRKKLNDIYGMGESYFNIADLHYGNKEFNKALPIIQKSVSLLEKTNMQIAAIYGYKLYGSILDEVGRTKEAEYYLLKSQKAAEDSGLIPEMNKNYQALSYHFEKAGDYKKAYYYKVKYGETVDSLFSQEKIKTAKELEKKFDSEKRELEISNLKKDKVISAKELEIAVGQKQKQLFFTIAISFILVLALFFSVFIVNRLRLTKKQKLIIEQQKHLVEEKHKEITDSINYAERIQRSFLATKEILNENLKSYFVFFQPKDVVSGDFYWASKLSNGNFALATADSTGHGVPGAIMSILNISSLEKSVDQGLSDPAEILNHTRINIIERLKKDGSVDGGKDGMDVSLISFDFKNNKLTYAAANNPVWIVRSKEMIELDPDKMPVGKHDRDSVLFTQYEFQLQKDDVVYALTDGMPDQFGGPKGKKFMYKQLKELLISISSESMEKQKEKLADALNNWKGNMEQVDDITLVGVRV